MHLGSDVIPLVPPITAPLYASRRDAQRALLEVAVEVIQEIVTAGGKPPPAARMVKDFDRLWDIWQHLAPSGR